jgi:hypothetical protein
MGVRLLVWYKYPEPFFLRHVSRSPLPQLRTDILGPVDEISRTTKEGSGKYRV